MADRYKTIRQTLENEKVDWNMPDYAGLPSHFLFSCQRLINGKYVSCFAKQEGAYVSVLTALTRVTGAKAHETHRLEAAVIQYFTFFLIKKNKIIYMPCFVNTWLWIFGTSTNPSTLVNVCQRIVFDASS